MLRHVILLVIFVSGLGVVQAQKSPANGEIADSLANSGEFEAAIQYYDLALATQPNDELLLRGKAYCYFNLLEMDKAREIYYHALKTNPKCLRCEIFLINILAYEKKYDAALSRADSVLAKHAGTEKNNIDYAEIKTQKANIYITMGNTAAAEMMFEELVQDYPDSSGAHYMLAEFNYHMGSKSKALRSVNKAIELKNNVASYYFLKCKIYIGINYYKDAKDIITKAIELDSAEGEYFGYRGGISHYFGEIEPAMEDYKKAIDLGASTGFYAKKLSELFLAKEDMDSLCMYVSMAKTALEEDTLSEDYQLYYKMTAVQKEEYCNAERASYYYQRGVAMYNKGLYDSAVSFYTAGLKKFPTQSVLMNFRGNALCELQEWEKALADYRNSLLYPEDMLTTSQQRFGAQDSTLVEPNYKGLLSSSYYGLSEACMNLGRFEEAKNTIDTALAIFPMVKDAPLFGYYNQLGRVQIARGYYDSALKEFEKVITLMPKDATGYINMAIATAFKAVGNPDNFIPYGLSSIFGGFQTIGSFKTQPGKLTDKQEVILQDALSYCERAIGLVDNAGEMYFVRAYIKFLAKKGGVCSDVERAKLLGFEEATTHFGKVCK